jgi:hypothetical protein
MSTRIVDRSRWMEQLAIHLASKTIRRVILPGSHDAGTASISSGSPLSPDAPDLPIPSAITAPVISAWSRAQSLHIGEQLQEGIRYFDLRVARNGSDGKLYYAHSMFADNVLDSISQITAFLQSHQRELVILDFQHFLNLSAEDHISLARALDSAFADLLVPPPQAGVFPTLEFVWSRHQQVIIVYSNESGGSEILATHTNFWSRNLLSSKWAETPDPIKLHEYLRNVITCAPSDQLFVLQGVLTPDTKMILHGLVGNPSSLQDLAQLVNPQLLSWCATEWANKGLNIIMVDWAVESGVVEYAIRMNT